MLVAKSTRLDLGPADALTPDRPRSAPTSILRVPAVARLCAGSSTPSFAEPASGDEILVSKSAPSGGNIPALVLSPLAIDCGTTLFVAMSLAGDSIGGSVRPDAETPSDVLSTAVNLRAAPGAAILLAREFLGSKKLASPLTPIESGIIRVSSFLQTDRRCNGLKSDDKLELLIGKLRQFAGRTESVAYSTDKIIKPKYVKCRVLNCDN